MTRTIDSLIPGEPLRVWSLGLCVYKRLAAFGDGYRVVVWSVAQGRQRWINVDAPETPTLDSEGRRLATTWQGE